MFCGHTPLVSRIKVTFAQNIGIMHINDIMAYSQLSGDDVLTNIFGDEESLDDSDSESGDDIYGYLGTFVLPHGELEEQSCILTGGVDEAENELSGKCTLSNNEEPLGDTHSESDMEQSDHSGMDSHNSFS